MSNRRAIHDRVLRAESPDELAEAYAEWAENYDSDLVEEMGYQAHNAAAELLHTHLNSADARILDVGCGTGLVGQELHRLGYRLLEGLDYSADMLAQAELKAVYQQLTQRDLTKPLDVEDERFDAIICVGTFTLGHIGPDVLKELTRITRADGFICFTVRAEAWTQHDYNGTINRLHNELGCELLVNQVVPYIQEEGSTCHLCLVRR